MKECTHYQRQMIDCAEDKLGPQERKQLLEHMKNCSTCAQEYQQIVRLFGVIAQGRVPLPQRSSFDRIRAAARTQKHERDHTDWKRLIRILIPAFAVAALILITIKPAHQIVEISIPVANLIEDDEIADIVIAGVVDISLIQEIASMEEYLSFDNEEAIEEMTREEKDEFVNSLNRKYAIGT